METATFRQFEKKFGKDWVCHCGAAFQAGWLIATLENKNKPTASYLCQVCGREQTLFLTGSSRQVRMGRAIEVSNRRLTSDDVLEIKREVVSTPLSQIRNLARRGGVAKMAAIRLARQQAP